MTDIAISIRGLGKRYAIGAPPQRRTLYDRVSQGMRISAAPVDRHPKLWALRDVSFDVPRGHVVGVLGSNGSGKSTLMKLLAQITVPTEGEARIRGRVGALLEVGTGFHPELTGRENIALSGAIMGMTTREIAAVEPAIVAFADIEEMLDTAVKHYSSGMFMRLAFSVAAHFDAEIMLIDEVLAVGDVNFQLKCVEKIRSAAMADRTVLFVSHAMESVRELCRSAIVLDHGRLRFNGPTAEAIDFYLNEIVKPAGS